jgi:hypothetical protein
MARAGIPGISKISGARPLPGVAEPGRAKTCCMRSMVGSARFEFSSSTSWIPTVSFDAPVSVEIGLGLL